MSLLPPEVHSALSQLLRALSTPDNAVRTQAEEQLNNDWIQNRPDVLLMGLAEQIQGAEDVLVGVALSGTKNTTGGRAGCVSIRPDCVFSHAVYRSQMLIVRLL